jgi:hypothetical protein
MTSISILFVGAVANICDGRATQTPYPLALAAVALCSHCTLPIAIILLS